MKSHNVFSNFKKVLCVVTLILYFSGLPVVLGNKPLGEAFTIAEFAVFFLMMPEMWGELKKLLKKPKLFLYVVVGFIMVFALDSLLWGEIIQPMLGSILKVAPNNANTESLIQRIHENPGFMIFGCVFFGPVLEEILYRYTAFGMLYGKNKFVAYFVTALIFGIQHVAIAGIWGGDYAQFLNIGGYMIFSLIMSFVYKKTDSLCVPILIHIAGNAIGVYQIAL